MEIFTLQPVLAAGSDNSTLVWILILVWTVISAWKNRKDPGYSRTALAAKIAFATLLVFSVLSVFLASAAEGSPAWVRSVSGIVLVLAALGAFSLCLTTLIVLYSSPRETRKRGLRFAWTTIVVVLILGFIGGGAAMRARSGAMGSMLAVTSKSGREYVSGTFNYAIVTPQDWLQMEPRSLSRAADYNARNPANSAFCFVVPEKLVSRIDLDLLLKAVRLNLGSVAKVESESTEDVTIDGREWKVLNAVAVVHGIRVHYKYHMAIMNGFAYQVGVGVGESSASKLDELAKSFMRGFRILDPNRKFEQESLLTSRRSDPWGYTAILTNGEWCELADAGKLYPNCNLVATSIPDRAMAVMPFALGELRPTTAALTRAFLGRIGCVSSQFSFQERRVLKNGEEWEVQGTRTSTATPFYYICRIVNRPPAALMIAAWSNDNSKESMERLKKDVAQVQVDEASPEETLPMSAKFSSEFLNDCGVEYYQDGNRPEALRFFRAAIDGETKEPQLIDNAVSTAVEMGELQIAAQILDDKSDVVAQSALLQACRAKFLAAKGNENAAVRVWKQAFALTLTSTTAWTEFLHFGATTPSNEVAKEALETAKAHISMERSPDLLLPMARLTARVDGLDVGIAMIAATKGLSVPEVQLAKLRLYLLSGENQKAVEIADEAIKESGNSWSFHALRGRALWNLQRLREAKIAYERAAELNPMDEGCKRSVADLSSALGQGETAMIKQVIAPAPLPQRLETLLRKGTLPTESSSDAIYLLRAKVREFDPGHASKLTRYHRVKVFNRAGTADFNMFAVPFDSVDTRIYVNELTVFGPDGKESGKGNPDSYYVTRRNSDGMADERCVLNIPIPGLQPGGSFVLVITEEDRGVADEIAYVRYPFASYYPVQNEAYVLRAPEGSYATLVPKSLHEEREKQSVTWSMENLPSFRWEAGMPNIESLVPVLYIGDKGLPWPKLGKEYLTRIHDRLEGDEKVAGEARILKESGTSHAELIRACARWVQESVSYTALEFGTRGRMPERPGTTLQNRYGDCKDHAVLLHALLRQVGIPSSLALVSTSDEVQESIPSLDQFNHMVVYVPEADSKFVDCTDKCIDPTRFVSRGIIGKKALILDKEPKFIVANQSGNALHEMNVTRRLRAEREGKWEVEETVELKGFLASEFRGFFRSTPEAQRKQEYGKYLAAGRALVDVHSLDAGDVQSQDDPLRVSSVYTVDSTGSESAGSLPWLLERNYIGLERGNRTLPYERDYGYTVRTDLTWAATEATQFNSPPDRLGAGILGWELRRDADGAQMHLTCVTKLASGRFEPTVYQASADAAAQLLGYLTKPTREIQGHP